MHASLRFFTLMMLLCACDSAFGQMRERKHSANSSKATAPVVSVPKDPNVLPVAVNPSPACANRWAAVSPGWGGGGGGGFFYPPSPPFVIMTPPSGVWRIAANGQLYYDVVSTPILMGGFSGYPSMPLSPLAASESFETPQPVMARMQPAPARVRERPRDTSRAKAMTEIGDRLFRHDMIPQAIKRYEQAIKADPRRAEPRARLAQIALVKGEYTEAANRLREAEAAEPGWLATADDVQKLYPEPTAFADHIAKLETHLQARPEDRDGWLVLGSLWYLSGRTQKAADVFLRLTDRKEDPTLKAFLAASKAK